MLKTQACRLRNCLSIALADHVARILRAARMAVKRQLRSPCAIQISYHRGVRSRACNPEPVWQRTRRRRGHLRKRSLDRIGLRGVFGASLNRALLVARGHPWSLLPRREVPSSRWWSLSRASSTARVPVDLVVLGRINRLPDNVVVHLFWRLRLCWLDRGCNRG